MQLLAYAVLVFNESRNHKYKLMLNLHNCTDSSKHFVLQLFFRFRLRCIICINKILLFCELTLLINTILKYLKMKIFYKKKIKDVLHKQFNILLRSIFTIIITKHFLLLLFLNSLKILY